MLEKKSELEQVQEHFYANLGKFLAKGMQLLTASQRSGAQLQALDAVCAFLDAYGPLIHCMEAASPRVYNDFHKVHLFALTCRRSFSFACRAS